MFTALVQKSKRLIRTGELVLHGVLDVDDDYHTTVWADGNFVYVTVGNEIRVFSIDAEGEFTLVSSFTKGSINFRYVWGGQGRIFATSSGLAVDAGFHCFSVSGAGVLTELDKYGTGGFWNGIWADNDFIYVGYDYGGAGNTGRLRSFSIDGSGQITYIDEVATSGDEVTYVAGDGRFIYSCGGYEGISTYSRDGSGNLTFHDRHLQAGNFYRGCWAAAGYVFVQGAEGSAGIISYAVDGSGNLTLVDSLSSIFGHYGLWHDGSFLYSAGTTDGLETLSVDGAGQLTRLDKDTSSNKVQGVFGAGGFVFTACQYQGVRSYSVI